MDLFESQLNVWPIEKLDKKAAKDLKENPKRTPKDIEHIRDWINAQPHLAETARKDDEFILHFLRGSKFSLEKTKTKIENWNTFRNLCPDIYQNWDPEDKVTLELLKLGMVVPLPGYDKHGRKVVIERTMLPDPNKYSVEEIYKTIFLIFDSFMKSIDYQTTVCGLVIINDTAGATMTHITNFPLSFGKKMMTIYQDSYPSQPKSMHMLNMPSFADALFNLMKGFLKDKMKERMFVHRKGDYSKLIETVGKDVLPQEYGGNNGNINELAESVEKYVRNNREWLIQQTKHKADESKRITIHKTYSEVFGMVGSFRKLEID